MVADAVVEANIGFSKKFPFGVVTRLSLLDVTAQLVPLEIKSCPSQFINGCGRDGVVTTGALCTCGACVTNTFVIVGAPLAVVLAVWVTVVEEFVSAA